MRRKAMRKAVAPGIVAGLALLCLAAERAPAQTTGTGTLVLRGGTVVVGDGRVLPNATVVVRDGLIAAVGRGAKAPAGARVVDVTGARIYPGLIDALTDGGLGPDPDAPAAKPGQPALPTDNAGPDGGGYFAHVKAAERVEKDAAKLAAWREAGVLALHAGPTRGIITGQTALVTTGGGESAPAVVRGPIAMRVVLRNLSAPRRAGMPVPGGIFPGALLTVWAHLRQTIFDAQHYDKAMALDVGPRGGASWPESERTLKSLQAVARGTMPLIIPATEEREVQRVLDFVDETGVRAIAAGGYEAAGLAPGLAKRRVPVLLSVNFPRKKASSVGQVQDIIQAAGTPDPEEPVRAMESRRHAPQAAAELAAARVPFAFYSDGLKTGAEFLGGIRTAVRHGLSREAALRAATLSTAEILGASAKLGSVEAGKVANLIVSDGDLFDDRSQIRLLVVDGRAVEPAKAAETAAAIVAATRAPLAFAATARAVEIDPPPAAPNELLITNATVMTATKGTLKDTSILVRGGKIAAVGTDLKASPKAMVVDGRGKWVTPGFIDTHAHHATDAHNDATVAVTSMGRIKDVIDPTDIDAYRVLAGGNTTSNVLHGSVNPIGGQSAVVKWRWGRPAREMLFEGAPESIKFAMGSNPKSRGTDPAPGVDRRYPASRMGVEDVIRTTFLEARAYRDRWMQYEKLKAAGQAPPLPPRRDLRLEPLAEVLEGKRIVHVHCYRADEMETLMRMGDELGFKVNVFHHAAESYKVASMIAKHGGAVAGFGLLGTKVESWDGIPQYSVILTRHGVPFSIGADSISDAAHLNWEAGKLTDEGLTEEEALAVITINAARQLGIDKRVGSIEVGKDADLVVFASPPLSVYSRPEMVFIDGQLYWSRERDRQRQQAVESEKKRLQALDAEEAAAAAPNHTTSNDPAPAPTAAALGVQEDEEEVAHER
jgi:imidazolonepropionase-like amidohydrolase